MVVRACVCVRTFGVGARPEAVAVRQGGRPGQARSVLASPIAAVGLTVYPLFHSGHHGRCPPRSYVSPTPSGVSPSIEEPASNHVNAHGGIHAANYKRTSGQLQSPLHMACLHTHVSVTPRVLSPLDSARAQQCSWLCRFWSYRCRCSHTIAHPQHGSPSSSATSRPDYPKTPLPPKSSRKAPRPRRPRQKLRPGRTTIRQQSRPWR